MVLTSLKHTNIQKCSGEHFLSLQNRRKEKLLMKLSRYLTKHCLTNSTCQVEASIQPLCRWDSPVVQSCRTSCHSALESCIINSTFSASVCTKLPSGDLPSQGDNALSGWCSHHCQTDAASVCLILLLFTVNNKVAFFFFFWGGLHQCLVSFVSMSLHSCVQSVKSGIRVCKAHQGKYYLVGICWSGLLDFPGDAIHVILLHVPFPFHTSPEKVFPEVVC